MINKEMHGYMIVATPSLLIVLAVLQPKKSPAILEKRPTILEKSPTMNEKSPKYVWEATLHTRMINVEIHGF